MANELKSYVAKVNPDEAFAKSLEEAVRRALPDGGKILDGKSDANLLDFCRIISGILVEIGTENKVAKLVIAGQTVALDASTNIIANPKNKDDIADGIVAAIAAGGTGLLIGLIGGAGAPLFVVASLATVGFFAGNYVSSYAPDFIDYIFGAELYLSDNRDTSKQFYTTNSKFSYTMRDNWQSKLKPLFSANKPFGFESTNGFDGFNIWVRR